MGLTVCPAAVVAAPVEVVWGNLVQWERYSEWADVQAERSEPEGPATVGQTISFAGKAFVWHHGARSPRTNCVALRPHCQWRNKLNLRAGEAAMRFSQGEGQLGR